MDTSIAIAALQGLDTEVLVIDLVGEIVFANSSARKLMDTVESGDGALGSFLSQWREPAAEIEVLLRRLAGTSQWQPFTLTRASGAHAGLRMSLRARAMRTEENGEPELRILVMQDFLRERSFGEHRQLIRTLNFELAKGRRSEEVLKSLLDTQKRLHRELIHRVKNNLALLTSLLRINRQRTNDPNLDSHLSEIERRILAIASVHNLLDHGQDVDFVRSDELIDAICTELEQAIAPVNVRIERELASVRLHISDATPLALIINELITNALKHAFPSGKGGRIAISLKKNGVEKLEATIADDGVGFREQLSDDDATMGTRIIESLAMQLDAEITRTGGNGTTWQLIFPPKEYEVN